MTERERWIVYPLLFLALGAALRDKLSEQTRTRRLECQELIVYGEDGAGRPPVPLVQIGGIERSSADEPHAGRVVVNGQVIVDGVVQANGVLAQDIQASRVNADSYFFHRMPLSPVMRSVPGATPIDPAQLQQLQKEAEAQKKNADEEQPEAASAPEKTGEAAVPPAE
jgi:hypothetical protein